MFYYHVTMDHCFADGFITMYSATIAGELVNDKIACP
jgi:hypothetical protein